jgi:hypothetical protein
MAFIRPTGYSCSSVYASQAIGTIKLCVLSFRVRTSLDNNRERFCYFGAALPARWSNLIPDGNTTFQVEAVDTVTTASDGQLIGPGFKATLSIDSMNRMRLRPVADTGLSPDDPFTGEGSALFSIVFPNLSPPIPRMRLIGAWRALS